MLNYYKDHLGVDYRIERAPAEARFASHSFARFDYASPVAKLHWRVLATEIRCHIVQFIFTGNDVRQIESLIENMKTMKLPNEAGPASGKGGGAKPACIKDFANAENLIEGADPVFLEPRFNPVAARIVIDAQGRVKHIHVLSAFPEQLKSISDALLQWRFKPYVLDGRAVEVETGIVFGHEPHPTASPTASRSR
ncbi:MAG: energy transducer TonB [Steroidobacteraceae bacterium]